MGRLKDKVVVITGGAGAIGSACAELAAHEGAHVVVADINEAGAIATAAHLRAAGRHAEAFALDLGDEASIRASLDFTVSRFGGVDALVNNAAALDLVRHGDGGIENMDVAVWDETMRINLRGTMLACKYAIPLMRARGGGSIVNVSSGSAMRGSLSVSAYAASKSAIATLSQYVAAQHGHEGIRCNTIYPGLILTPSTEKIFEAAHDQILEHTLSPRLGKPADIAWAMFFLIADEGAYINGQSLPVDGGIVSHQKYWLDLPRREARAAAGIDLSG